MKKTDSNGLNGRDNQGRFTPGNRHGKGNPRIRTLSIYRETINRAVSPTSLRKIIRKLVELAEAGDTIAAREVLDRCLGKPTPPGDESDISNLNLPPLKNLDDAAKVASLIISGMGEGKLSPESGMKMITAVEVFRKSIETAELERRISILEVERGAP